MGPGRLRLLREGPQSTVARPPEPLPEVGRGLGAIGASGYDFLYMDWEFGRRIAELPDALLLFAAYTLRHFWDSSQKRVGRRG